jgi:hypothetical protein
MPDIEVIILASRSWGFFLLCKTMCQTFPVMIHLVFLESQLQIFLQLILYLNLEYIVEYHYNSICVEITGSITGWWSAAYLTLTPEGK